MKRRVMNIYQIFSLIEIVLFLIFGMKIWFEKEIFLDFKSEDFVIDAVDGKDRGNELDVDNTEMSASLTTEEIYLKRGIYDISIFYDADGTGNINVVGNEIGPGSLWMDYISLSNSDTCKKFQIWVNDPNEKVYFQVNANVGSLRVNEIWVKTAEQSRIYNAVCLFLIFFVANSLFAIYYYRKKLRKYSVEIVGIAGITLLASAGVLTRYMLPGHDLLFHLLRIEGLKDGLMSGAFPVRIQPNWCNGWGYAVSVMYGDATLFLPALMRMIGFTVQTSYKTFIIAMNLATAFTAWYCFYKIGKNRYGALLGSFLYVMAPYRLCCIYIRGAFGEYAAMIFLPLTVLWLWYVFHEDTEKKDYGRRLTVPIIGFSGLLQTHILTCQMVGIFIVLLCLLIIGKMAAKGMASIYRVGKYVIKTAILTVCVNLWFLIPFLSYFKEDLICTEFREMALDYQMLGVSVAELLAQETSGYYGYSWSELTSLGNKFSIPLSNGLLLCAGFALLLLWKDKIKEKSAAAIVLLLGGFSVWMATNLFPYRKIGIYMPKLAAFLAKPGLPYRYLSISCVLLSTLAVIVYGSIKKEERKIAAAMFTVVVLVAADQGVGFIYQTLYNGYYELHYDGGTFDTTNLMGSEYLYQGSEVGLTGMEQKAIGYNTDVSKEQKNYNYMEIDCCCGDGEAYLEVPLFYYPGYTAYDKDNKKNIFEVTRGSNNCVRVSLPAGYEGTVSVKFKEPAEWRVAEILSLITIVCFIFLRNSCTGNLKRV